MESKGFTVMHGDPKDAGNRIYGQFLKDIGEEVQLAEQAKDYGHLGMLRSMMMEDLNIKQAEAAFQAVIEAWKAWDKNQADETAKQTYLDKVEALGVTLTGADD